MSEEHDAEPVFVRSKWGTNRHVYNPNNPVGMALIVGSLLLLLGGFFYLHDSSSWSEGEFHDAVHSAAESLEARPQLVGGLRGSYEQLISDAVENSDEGPVYGVVNVEPDRDTTDAVGAADRFEVTVDDVDDVYCLHVSPPEPDGYTSIDMTLDVTVDDGRC